MSTKEVILQGKAKWASLHRPDKFDAYSINLYMTDESIAVFNTLKLKTELKKDEDGYYAKFRCPLQKMMRGKLVALPRPAVVDKDHRPIETIVGNGSDVTLKLDWYDYKSPKGEKGYAVRLTGVRVDNLVEYEADRDMTKDEQQLVGGMSDKPVQMPAW